MVAAGCERAVAMVPINRLQASESGSATGTGLFGMVLDRTQLAHHTGVRQGQFPEQAVLDPLLMGRCPAVQGGTHAPGNAAKLFHRERDVPEARFCALGAFAEVVVRQTLRVSNAGHVGSLSKLLEADWPKHASILGFIPMLIHFRAVISTIGLGDECPGSRRGPFPAGGSVCRQSSAAGTGTGALLTHV